MFADLYFFKWDDQSAYRGTFAMEWYVLGNGGWDFSAVNPPTPNPQPLSPAQQAGLQFSDYPDTTRTTDPYNRCVYSTHRAAVASVIVEPAPAASRAPGVV
jgi:hypothetical protein